MTLGYICDMPGCETFQTGTPIALFEHTLDLVNDDGEVRRERLSAHYCHDCALEVSRRMRLLPAPEEVVF